MNNLFKQYTPTPSVENVRNAVNNANNAVENKLYTLVNLKRIFSFIDLTTLNIHDRCESVKKLHTMLQLTQQEHSNLNIPMIPAVCVYPSLIECAKNELKSYDLEIVSVVGGFPASQTFLDVKKKEAEMAISAGASELDMVLSVGKFLDGNYTEICDEIKAMKTICGKIHLKVILETGVLQSYDNIYRASILALESGADFIKTSTGKVNPSATPEAFYIMTCAISEYFRLHKVKKGIKAAGGISTGKDALVYYSLLVSELEESWSTPNLFRIGASSLLTNLLKEIQTFLNSSEI